MADAGLDRPVTYVLTRERVRPTNRWRSDPEWRIARQIEVPFDQAADVSAVVRVDRRASDAVLAELIGLTGPTSTARLTGVPSAGGWAAADGDDATAWITPFNEVVGSALHADLVDPDETLTLAQRPGNYSLVTAVRLTQGARSVDVCWWLRRTTPRGRMIFMPSGFTAGPLTIEIAAVAERTTRDRRFGDTVVMPAAITEIGNIASAMSPLGSTPGAATTSSPSPARPCPSASAEPLTTRSTASRWT